MRLSFKSKQLYYVSLAFFVVLIRIFSLNDLRVENYYSTRFYIYISAFLRNIFGWIPFSIGDIFYAVIIIWVIIKLIKFIKAIIRRKINKAWMLCAFKKSAITLAWIYIIFNLAWGLNYDRKGIAYQLQLDVKPYTLEELKNIQDLLIEKVNTLRISGDTNSVSPLNKKDLFQKSQNAFAEVSKKYAFLKYRDPSVKSSLFGVIGNYLGFTGYYNPFTAEAQVNTTVPAFTLPYTACHEMAHQLGYAKEDEANFVGYLAASNSSDSAFRYATYFDLFFYANREIFIYDSTFARNSVKQLTPEVKHDYRILKNFWRKYRSPLDPLTLWIYGSYLKANRQPKGMQTYNEVIANLIAFYKKYGYI